MPLTPQQIEEGRRAALAFKPLTNHLINLLISRINQKMQAEFLGVFLPEIKKPEVSALPPESRAMHLAGFSGYSTPFLEGISKEAEALLSLDRCQSLFVAANTIKTLKEACLEFNKVLTEHAEVMTPLITGQYNEMISTMQEYKKKFQPLLNSVVLVEAPPTARVVTSATSKRGRAAEEASVASVAQTARTDAYPESTFWTPSDSGAGLDFADDEAAAAARTAVELDSFTFPCGPPESYRK